MGLQACVESPQLLAQLGGAMLEEVDALDRRLIQLTWMGRCAEPQLQECNLQPLLAGWAQERGITRLECPSLRVCLDPDLIRVAFFQLCDNADRHAGGVSRLRVVANDLDWQLQLDDSGEGWPEGLVAWLKDPQLWRGQIALGLPLVQKVLASHGGKLLLDQPPACWTVPRGVA
jgi:signal transduction histidine kinase